MPGAGGFNRRSLRGLIVPGLFQRSRRSPSGSTSSASRGSWRLSAFLTAQTMNLPQLFIAATIAILPVVVMFVFLQRWIVERSGISE
jgi:hypothetical protein